MAGNGGGNNRGGRPTKESLNEHGLNVMQDQFCREYIVDYNLKQAAIRAGYSPASAHNHAKDLYKLPKIRERIAQLLRERRQEYDVTVERMQQEIARIAFADPTELLEEMGGVDGKITVKNLAQIPKRLRAAIKSIAPGKEGIRITFHEKTQALDMLAKHFGFYEKDNDQKKPEGGVALYLPDNGRGGTEGLVVKPAPGTEGPEAQGAG